MPVKHLEVTERLLRVLALPRYGPLGASSRLRMWQYLPWLEAAGLNVVVRPLLPDSYIHDLQGGRRSVLRLAAAYSRQIRTVSALKDFDVIWMEKELLPWVPGFMERGLLPRDVPLVLDYDDAVYHLYEQHRSPLIRSVLGRKHADAMRGAALVTVGNATLAERAYRAGAPNTQIVPTVIDLKRYPLRPPYQEHDRTPTVCWIGQRSTAAFLAPYRDLFASLASEGTLSFTAIGIDAVALRLPMMSLPWSQAGEVDAIMRCDIGIMPLVDGPFERGKCGYKLIQYMACSLPVVASPVGVNCQIVDHGVNGFLASTEQEWRQALTTLAVDPELRARMGRAGRAQVEALYSLQNSGPLVANLLRSAAQENSQ